MTVDEVANQTKEQGGRRSRRSRQAVTKSENSSPTAGQRKERPTPTRREATNKGNFITRFFRGIANYFVDTRAELQKVTWPTRQETLRLSGIVLAVTAVFSVALGLLDYLYGELFRIGFSSPIVFVIFGVALVIVVGGSTLMLRRRGSL